MEHLFKFESWVQYAKPGDKFVYYTGYLAKDRSNDFNLRRLTDVINQFCNNKKITVYQKRVSDFGAYCSKYDYIAYKLK